MGKKINRETYLEVAKIEISTLFKSKGYTFKAKDLKGIKVTTSFPTSGGQSASAPIGLCCYEYNKNTEILISPVLGGKTIKIFTLSFMVFPPRTGLIRISVLLLYS